MRSNSFAAIARGGNQNKQFLFRRFTIHRNGFSLVGEKEHWKSFRRHFRPQRSCIRVSCSFQTGQVKWLQINQLGHVDRLTHRLHYVLYREQKKILIRQQSVRVLVHRENIPESIQLHHCITVAGVYKILLGRFPIFYFSLQFEFLFFFNVDRTFCVILIDVRIFHLTTLWKERRIFKKPVMQMCLLTRIHKTIALKQNL